MHKNVAKQILKQGKSSETSIRATPSVDDCVVELVERAVDGAFVDERFDVAGKAAVSADATLDVVHVAAFLRPAVAANVVEDLKKL